MIREFFRTLPIRGRLMLILIAFMVPTVGLLWLLTGYVQRDITFTETQRKGVAYIKPLSSLLDEVADYQMAVVMASRGDNEAMASLPQGRKSIDDLVLALLDVEKRHGASLLPADAVKARNLPTGQSVADQWQLLRTAKSYTPDAWKALTDSIAALITALGDSSGMVLDPDLDSYYLVMASLSEFPVALQHLADIKNRVYHLLTANSNVIPEQDRMTLATDAGLIEKQALAKIRLDIETTLAEDAAYYGTSPSLKPALVPLLDAYDTAARNLVKIIHQLGSGQSMTAPDFLTVADVLHDGTAEAANVVLDELDKLLVIRITALQKKMTVTLGGCAAALLVAFALFFLVARTIVRPVRHIQGVLERIAQGDTSFDLPGRKGRDEISLLTNAAVCLKERTGEAYRLGQMVQDMPTGVMMVDVRSDFTIRYVNNALSKIFRTIKSALPCAYDEVTGKSIDIFTPALPDIRQILENASSLPKQVKIRLADETVELLISPILNKEKEYVAAMFAWQVISAREKLANDFEQNVKGIVNIVASAATELSSSAQSMVETVQQSCTLAQASSREASSTSSNVQAVAEAVEEMSSSLRDMSSQLHVASNMVSESTAKASSADRLAASLMAATDRVSATMEMIISIAAKTDLLAMNATIESARAGEAGKGFAVVASEVKSLATQTNNNVVEIQQVVGEMRTVSTTIVEALRDITSSIGQIKDSTTRIFATAESQSNATNEIASNMQHAANSSRVITDNLENVNTSSAAAGGAAQQVLSASQELSVQAESLNRQVDMFLERIRAG